MKYNADTQQIFDEQGRQVAARNNGSWLAVLDDSKLAPSYIKRISTIVESHADQDGIELAQLLTQAVSFKVLVLNQEKLSELFDGVDCSQVMSRIKYFHISDFDYYEKRAVFFIAKTEELIIGIAKIHPSHDDVQIKGSAPWVAISYLSVDEEYRGHGVASSLNEAIFQYAAENKLKLSSSSYSESGAKHLKPMNYRLAEKYGVDFKDKDQNLIKEFEEGIGRKATPEEIANLPFTRFPG
jgi:GNAT superfamily N-acetyltransferase